MFDNRESIIRRMLDDVWNKGNMKLADELFTPNYTEHDPVSPVRGIQQLKDTVHKYRNSFPDCRIDVDELLTAGDKVVVRWHYSGTHQNVFEGIQPTGRRVTGPGISIYRFEGDKIAEAHTSWDALGLMQQLGVVTLPGKVQRAGA